MPRTETSLEAIKVAAAHWVPRLDAGLSDAEEEEFAAWIEADPRHAEILAQQQAVWNRYAALAPLAGATPDPDRFAPSRTAKPVLLRFAGPALAAAAALAAGFILWSNRETAWSNREIASTPVPLVLLPAPLVQQTLPDGSIVELNRGAEIAVAYSDSERRVSLLRGEANFSVAKNPHVPFIVFVGGVEVCAVGTAFNIRYDPTAVEVVVSEGKVAVTATNPETGNREPESEDPANSGLTGHPQVSASASSLPAPGSLLLSAGQSTVVPLTPAPSAPAIVTLTQAELQARLAWQPKLFDFDDAPLSEIVAGFNERNPVHLVIRDPAIASLRLSASFRSDNMEGFVRLLSENFQIHAESLSPSTIALRRRR